MVNSSCNQELHSLSLTTNTSPSPILHTAGFNACFPPNPSVMYPVYLENAMADAVFGTGVERSVAVIVVRENRACSVEE